MELRMLVRKTPDVRSSEITSRAVYLSRREFLVAAGIATLAARRADAAEKLTVSKRLVTTDEALTPQQVVTTFNNFYEFGTDKGDPAKNSKAFKPKPWSVAIDGLCNKPGTYTLEDIVKPHSLEERVYRHRCVEGWSIVVPWVGFPLGDLLKRFEPTGAAKFVEFTTVQRPDEMPSQRRKLFSPLPWPYREGLRIDEAMHPLAILAVGLYGEELPNQNGAPLRLVVPWKYGFKSIKSIVKIQFTDKQPKTTWEIAASEYYGFYSNVNPNPTASTFRDQATERRLGEFFMRKTAMFNGYGDQVASLYSGLDLRRNY